MYRPKFSKSVIKQFSKIPPSQYENIFRAIMVLCINPIDKGLPIKKLTDKDEFRLRVGNYRVLYTANHTSKELVIAAIKHRRNAY